jgi:hypothetical protein
MRATVYGETSKATEYMKQMIVADCGLEWFELKGRLMARNCYVEIA